MNRTLTVRAGATAALLAIGLITTACSITRAHGTGPTVIEARDVAGFTKIEASYGIGVTVRIGETGSLEVHSQRNLLPVIATEVRDGTLRIRSTTEYDADTRPEVVIVLPRLEGISLCGGSQGRVEGLAADLFGIHLSGGAGLTASGTIRALALEGSGGALAALEGLAAEGVVLDPSGGSMAKVHASGVVTGDIGGASQVTVSGEARVEVDSSGGSVIHG